MKPLNQHVFIRPEFRPDKIGGIYIPESSHEHLPQSGVVLSIADGVAADFKVGDRVIYNRYKSDITSVKDEKGAIAKVKVGDVIAVITP